MFVRVMNAMSGKATHWQRSAKAPTSMTAGSFRNHPVTAGANTKAAADTATRKAAPTFMQ